MLILEAKKLSAHFPSPENEKILNAEIKGLSWDTRTIKPGEWYLPVVGESLDGHKFVNNAFEKGAVGAFCDQAKIDQVDEKYRSKIILVPSVDAALHAYVTEELVQIKELNPKVKIVAISGSAGKTTTREMCVCILSAFGKVLGTKENYNTFWGNAYLLQQYDNEDFIVTEMGLGYENEVRVQMEAVKPDIGLLMNIGTVHAETAGGPEGVYTGKKSLVDIQLRDGRMAVVNADGEKIDRVIAEHKGDKNLYTIGKDGKNFMSYRDIQVDINGTRFAVIYNDESCEVKLPLIGDYYFANSLLSLSASVLFGNDFKKSCQKLEEYSGYGGRFERIPVGKYVTLINDAYNANPISLDRSLRMVTKVWPQGEYRRIAVIGDMGALGEDTIPAEKKISETVDECHYDEVYYLGKYGELFHATKAFTELTDAVQQIQTVISAAEKNKQPTVILIKSSHSVGLYKVPELLKEAGIKFGK